VRDQRYLAWRFLNPRSLYRFLFWEASKLEGYLVLQAKRYKHKVSFNIGGRAGRRFCPSQDLVSDASRGDKDASPE
jgi:hypothetical protein